MQAEHLELLLEPLGKQVRSYFGNQGGGTLPKGTAVAVCTIEKANSLINRLLEEGRLSELGIIVIDELHMVWFLHISSIWISDKLITVCHFYFLRTLSLHIIMNALKRTYCAHGLYRWVTNIGVICWNLC